MSMKVIPTSRQQAKTQTPKNSDWGPAPNIMFVAAMSLSCPQA